MKKILCLLLVFLSLAGSVPRVVFSSEAPDLSASGAVIINAATKEIIFGINEKKSLPMASTTKIMTALLTLEAGNLYEEFTVDKEAIKIEGTSMGLREGDKATLYSLCVGMLLSSGNDAASAAAVRISGTEEKFVSLMNQRAKEMGLDNTRFENPTGLHSENHYSTAYDMALLGAAALENELLRENCSEKSIQVSFGEPAYSRTLYNHNKLLTYSEEYLGIKTGFTKKAGRCLVSAREREGVLLVAVTLNDKDDWADHEELYDYAFSRLQKTEFSGGEVSFPAVSGEKGKIMGAYEGGEVYYIGNEPTMKVIAEKFLYAPIKKGEEIGRVEFYQDGKIIKSFPVLASEENPLSNQKLNIFQKLVNLLRRIFALKK